MANVKKQLTDEQRQIIEDNKGLFINFANKQLEKGIISYNDYDDFIGYLQYRFCLSLLKFDSNISKISTFSYKTFIYAKIEFVKNLSIYRDRFKMVFDSNIPSNYINSENIIRWNRKPCNEHLNFHNLKELYQESKLNSREIRFLEYHFLYKKSYSQIAKLNNRSKEWARKITIEAMRKIKKLIDEKGYEIKDFLIDTE